MAGDCRFEIPKTCRDFGDAREEILSEKLRIAKNFIEKFVERVATPKGMLDASDEAWTQSVRRRFIEICPKGCYPLPSDWMTSKGEYLADYTWAEEENGKRVLLACESEWGTRRYGRTYWSPVEHDFEKLLAIKAPFKVLIFSSYDEKKAGCSKPAPESNFTFDFAKGRLKDSLEHYGHHLPGEAYIFIDFPQTGEPNGRGRYQYAIWLPKRYGTQEVAFDRCGGDKLSRPSESNFERP